MIFIHHHPSAAAQSCSDLMMTCVNLYYIICIHRMLIITFSNATVLAHKGVLCDRERGREGDRDKAYESYFVFYFVSFVFFL